MSGTAMIDLASDGDLQHFLSVGGAHDAAFDSFGVIDPASFTAYPWSTPIGSGNTAYNSLDKLRRAMSGKIVEEWLLAYQVCHGRAALATAHDALDTWLRPIGDAAGALTIGGVQFNGQPFCKTSWWKHVNRQRFCIERAKSASNLWAVAFTGSHSGSGTITGSFFTGTGTGTLTGTPSGSYSITIDGELTGAGPDGTFSGTVSGALTGTYIGTIVAGVVSSVIWGITSPADHLVVSTGGTFTVGGGGTTFTFSGGFTGSETPDTHATVYVNARAQSETNGYGRGKPHWGGGWRQLLFPWGPATSYQGTSALQLTIQVNAQQEKDAGAVDDGSGFLDSFPADLWGVSTAYISSPTVRPSGVGWFAGSQRWEQLVGVITTIETTTVTKCASWVLFPGPALTCSSGTTVTRPASSLKNVFGWVSAVMRAKLAWEATPGASSVAMKMGFFWADIASFAAISGSYSSKILEAFRDESIELGAITTSESSVSVASALTAAWPVNATSAGTRFPVFWIGPAWGDPAHDAPAPGTAWGEFNRPPRTSGVSSADTAATAGVEHLIPWAGGGDYHVKIGTDLYPFR